jgi:pSer/pThr/pTyr-binding forkhead associated (FHA) protein
MTKKEALDFLELPESSSDPDIKARIEEKISYFELLSENSTSVFLRRIHEQNLNKVKSIQKEWQGWSPPIIEKPAPEIREVRQVPEPSLPKPDTKVEEIKQVPETPLPKPEAKIEEIKQVPEIPLTKPETKVDEIKQIPEIPIPGPAQRVQEIKQVKEVPAPEPMPQVQEIKKPHPPEPQPAPDVREKIVSPVVEKLSQISHTTRTEIPSLTDTQMVRMKPAADPVGWLVRHTENKPVKSFPLFFGKNYIGRKVQPGFKPFIEVEDDLFVSRIHAVLNVEGARPFLFYITDTPAANGGKPSKNGTYVNGSHERVNVKTILHDYDTVQIGETKFVLRFEIGDLSKMQEQVEDRAYMHTVVIKVRE